MYRLTEDEKATFAKMEERKKRIERRRRTQHKCHKCVWSNWVNDKQVLCTYSPVNCVKDEVK